MRPASEIHTALEIVESELGRQPNDAAKHNLSIARDVLAWVARASSGDPAQARGPTAPVVVPPPKR